MIGNADLSSKFALDVQGVDQLKLAAKQSSPAALKAAAQQFEAVFMNMMMKSMRDATPQDGMFDSEQTRMYTSMLDQQMTQHLASRGIGLAEIMERQLSGAIAAPSAGAGAMPVAGPAAQGLPLTPALVQPMAADTVRTGDAPQGASDPLRTTVPQGGVESNAPPHVASFIQRMLPHAQAASASSGIPAKFMMGQAALETGWGRAEVRGADGQNSHNLFGIKAGAGWKGRTVDIATTEYVNGKPQKQVDTFRAYDSYAESFQDYANLLRSNPRYQNVIAQGQDAAGFAQGLQQAGYATDPNYAQKLTNVIRQVERA